MKHNLIITAIALLSLLAIQTRAVAPELPNPVLAFMGSELIEKGGKQRMRYHFDVPNKSEYPAEMFAPAPELPPCGANKNAARTWVDIYEQSGKRLNGFCSLAQPADLGKIWFEIEASEVPPSWVYIELLDRKSGTKYKSNLSETTL